MGYIAQEPGVHVEWQTFTFDLDLTLRPLVTKTEWMSPLLQLICVIKRYFFIIWSIFLGNWFPSPHIFTFFGSLLRFNLNFCFIDDPDPDDGFNYKQMMVRDERRFKMADKDGDLIATKEEFTAFLHPEEYDYMKDIVVQVGDSKDSQQKCGFCLLLTRLSPFLCVWKNDLLYSAGQLESRLCHCFSMIKSFILGALAFLFSMTVLIIR